MIPKADVKVIGLHRVNGRLFSVAGYEKLGSYPAHRKRIFKNYPFLSSMIDALDLWNFMIDAGKTK